MGSDQSAHRIVVALVRDLFFAVKLGKELRGHGYEPRIVKSVAEFVARLGEDDPVLGIVDLTAVDDWDQISQAAGVSGAARVPLLGFGPHKDVERRRAAQAAGLTRIFSNSQFHAEAPRYVQRVALR